MNQTIRAAAEGEPYDYRRHDRIWQRVMPSLNPYPGGTPLPETSGSAAAEETLPGAQANPCCMGSAAEEMLEVLEGFIEGELADHRYYEAFARQSPARDQQTLRRIAREEFAHARHLMAVYYLITGRCYQTAVDCGRIYVGGHCAALRQRYHEEACGGFNYLRAAEGTTDPCLQKILTELSEEEYRHARQLTALLEQAMNGSCARRGMGV